ncbi:DUF2934 domain-containing protein [Salinicola avicenniae]|uniref:DUF2934 domain-containing protein n=1 Tax=Salinicola avicenniae TaxID=2916836 RepID=UPI002072FAA4|nr:MULTISPECIES: DUF2934 domain-containing protein [unclassified Salinicola]
MMSSREQRVRMLAYRLWESEGRPDGQEARHWVMAERIVEAENAREEEQEWQAVRDEPSPLEGEDPTAEPDEIGIDESRLPLDDPETEARKEADTGVEPTPPRKTRAGRGKSTASQSMKSKTGEESGGEKRKPVAKPRKRSPSGEGDKNV